MAEWAWHAYDAVTTVPLGPVSMVTWSHEDRLNDSGAWTASMAPPQSATMARATLAATFEARTVVIAFRDGLPAFTGWLPPGGRRTPELAGGGLLSYLDRRVVDFTVTFASVDQFGIVQFLIDSTQDDNNGLMIDTSQAGTSGVLRDQQWFDYEMKNVGEAIRQKSALIDGFDFDIRTELEGGDLFRRLRCWYPRRGRVFVHQFCPVFTLGGNLLTIPQVVGNPDFVTVVHALGEEIDETTRERLRYRTFSLARAYEGWPAIDHVLDFNDVKTMSVLEDHADGHLALNSLNTSEELVLDVDPADRTWPWMSWELGDDCQVVIPAGMDPWWPDGYNEIRRIVAHRWSVDENGERLQVVTGRRLP